VPFAPFTDRDFDAFLDNKWRSNVFNRERLEVKQKLLALGRSLNSLLLTADGALLACEASAEHPAIWNQHCVQNQYLFFSRDAVARRDLDTIISKSRPMAALIDDPSPLRNHIFLSLMIDKSQVELALKLHSDASVDRENLQRKCQDFFLREKILDAIRDLPDAFRIGLSGQEDLGVKQITDEKLQRLIQELPTANGWLQVRHSLARDNPLVRTEEFVEIVREDLVRLSALMIFIAWSHENDFVSMRETLKQKIVEEKARGLVKNDHVRIVHGLFSGKTGIVQETDIKGGIKVLVGTMVVKLGSGDVEKG
jgi:hypothetical protein